MNLSFLFSKPQLRSYTPPYMHFVSHTAYPDGSVLSYMYGMEPPVVDNLGPAMKAAAYKAATGKRSWEANTPHKQEQEEVLEQYKRILKKA